MQYKAACAVPLFIFWSKSKQCMLVCILFRKYSFTNMNTAEKLIKIYMKLWRTKAGIGLWYVEVLLVVLLELQSRRALRPWQSKYVLNNESFSRHKQCMFLLRTIKRVDESLPSLGWVQAELLLIVLNSASVFC